MQLFVERAFYPSHMWEVRSVAAHKENLHQAESIRATRHKDQSVPGLSFYLLLGDLIYYSSTDFFACNITGN